MTSKTIFAISLAAATAVGGTAYASGDHGAGKPANPGAGQGAYTQQAGPGMMGGMMGGGAGGPGMMGGMGGPGHMGGGMMGVMKKLLDADGDGKVTPEEARAQLQTLLTDNDADGNGSLDIAEFEALHSKMIREKMVDRFQYLDADGDGAVTAEEMTAPADRLEKMRRVLHSATQPNQGKVVPGQGMMGQGQNMMGQGQNADTDGDDNN